jgi:hypothetical protein
MKLTPQTATPPVIGAFLELSVTEAKLVRVAIGAIAGWTAGSLAEVDSAEATRCLSAMYTQLVKEGF